MAYITVDELRAYMKDPGQLSQNVYEDAIAAAEIEINSMCGRYFDLDSGTSDRFYWPDDPYSIQVDDIATTTGLLINVDQIGDGTYTQPWTITTDFFLEPVNQIQAGIKGWPFNTVQATLTTKYFPLKRAYYYRRPTVKITATWGWPAVPVAVKQATAVVANKLVKMGEAPFGVAGYDQWGTIRVGNIPEVQNLLNPFLNDRYVVA